MVPGLFAFSLLVYRVFIQRHYLLLIVQIPAIAKSGDKGSIIVNSSAMGERSSKLATNAGVYAASKAGANMLVKYAAMEVRPT